ncbi:hypothetical protein ACER0A_013435 [Haloimpatiens sp. FM7315]|uniref:hypothetical protein n=1 Tax=Haloimpatiens sp. FM7315 TaxID=3298609 RepID=UPI00397747BC
MFFFCLILIICVGTFGYFTLINSKKSDTLKRQLMLVTKQNDSLKNKTLTVKKAESINITYYAPKYKLGLILNNCSLYLSPLEDSPVLNSLKENTKVYILDRAEVNSNAWFYINLYSEENVNNKGWIKDQNLSFIEENSEDI